MKWLLKTNLFCSTAAVVSAFLLLANVKDVRADEGYMNIDQYIQSAPVMKLHIKRAAFSCASEKDLLRLKMHELAGGRPPEEVEAYIAQQRRSCTEGLFREFLEVAPESGELELQQYLKASIAYDSKQKATQENSSVPTQTSDPTSSGAK